MAEPKARRYNMDTILEEWREDCQIDQTKLDVEQCRTPQLLHKYVKYYQYFKDELITETSRLNRGRNIKRKYYRGECTLDDLKKYGWQQFQGLKVTSNTEMNAVLECDLDIIAIQEELDRMNSNIKTLEFIMKEITNRTYAIKNTVEYLKYINGA